MNGDTTVVVVIAVTVAVVTVTVTVGAPAVSGTGRQAGCLSDRVRRNVQRNGSGSEGGGVRR